MSGQLRAIKNRIRSVENTKKITHAMEMVAAAKLRRFQDMMVKAKPYTQGLAELTARLLQDQLTRRAEAQKHGRENKRTLLHPFFETREEKRTGLVLFTSDTGLCGSYNTELVEIARRFLDPQREREPVLMSVGKFGAVGLKRLGFKFHRTFQDLRASRVEEILKALTGELENLYLEKKVDSISVVYSHFLTFTTYKGTLEKLLPFKSPADLNERSEAVSSDYIYEPSPEIIFKKLIPLFFEAKIRMIFLESFVSEQIARMTAMHLATENAEEMIDSLVLVRNKARQASITKEIIEIISGSRALKIK